MYIDEQSQNTFKMAVVSHSAIKVAPTVWYENTNHYLWKSSNIVVILGG